MADPKRLLGGDAPETAQQLLRAIEVPAPPSLGKQAELAQRLATLAAGPGLAPASVWAGPWWKLGLVGGGSVAGVALLLTVLRTHSAEPEAATSRTVKVEAIVSAPSVAQAPPDPPVVDASFTRSDPAARHLPTSNARVRSASKAQRDTLAEEEALLERARSFSSQAPVRAWGLLEKHRQRFAAGQLVAERMSLGVDVLERLGKTRAAQAQAEALIQQFPSSVYAVQLQQRRRSAQ